MLSGNKGEWSEIYTLLKIIGDRVLFPGDSLLRVVNDLIFPVVSILRDESNGTLLFEYDRDLVLVKNGEEELRVPVSVFKQQSDLLLNEIKKATTSTFQIEETEQFIRSLKIGSIKANSSAKSDIRIVIHDARTGTNPVLGFSIKSQLGEASTLLNAGKTTNFIYEINGGPIEDARTHEINAIDSRNKIQDRIRKILANGKRLVFSKTENQIFGNNLVLIDTALPYILAEIIYKYYTTSDSTIVSLLKSVTKNNPLGYDLANAHPFYEYKIKRFLTDIALGMMPSKVWMGEFDATGGYLVVKDTGEIICYHIYNKNEFENYLLHNTKLETASSRKYGFGILYNENTSQYFKLNLQIRFIR